jgi:hypothetical protein
VIKLFLILFSSISFAANQGFDNTTVSAGTGSFGNSTGADSIVATSSGSSIFHVRSGANNAVVLGQGGTTTALHEINGSVIATSVNVGTLTNLPTSGDPATFLKIKINGNTYFIPAWTAP